MENNSVNKYPKVCRTCLAKIGDSSTFLCLNFDSSTERITMRNKLLECIPGLNLGVTPDAVVCGDCSVTIDSAYQFKERCLKIEDCIQSVLQEMDCATTSVDLSLVAEESRRDSSLDRPLKLEFEAEECINEKANVSCYGAVKEEHRRLEGREMDLHDLHEARHCEESTSSNGEQNAEKKLLYKCKKCAFSTFSRVTLVSHLKMHARIKSYKCRECEYVTRKKRGLIMHMKVHARGKLYKWNINTGRKPYKCKICDTRFVSRYNLKMHLFTHTGEKPFKCTYCDHCAIQANDLKIHMRIHATEKLHKCKVCNYNTTSITGLVRHMNTHSEDKPFKCAECDYITTQLHDLNMHRQSHAGNEPNTCTVCHYSTVSKTGLVRHMNSHSEDEPLECVKHEHGIAQANDLKINRGPRIKKESYKRNSQSEDMPFKCMECDYSTTQSTHLKNHRRSHVREKPYKCSVCNYSMASKTGLVRHMNSHSVESH